ncbi:tRNA guanosine(34) transglycosylase Tgt [Candidatus Pacearchaeota archaeon]|nr:tRNA guanosine(34) transglycosylase Tgt [Candidatus Pacearchaeota archaeon]
MVETFEIKCKDKKTNARIGTLNTKSGCVETPFFMPVATRACGKFIDSRMLKEMNANAIISNALILHLNPGEKIVKKMGGIGRFMNYNGVNFTDSGGFQMYSESIFINSNDSGVKFRNPMNGDKLFITPEKNMEIQLDIGSDVAMCLDSMPLYERSKKEIGESVRLTGIWAGRCKKHHDKLQKGLGIRKRQLLFGITQGGKYLDLRKKSCSELVGMDFDGYSIGGFGMGETFEEEMRIVKQQKEIIPENKPVYLMGIGNPYEIIKAISFGVDIFDSRMPTMSARRGTLFTSKGKVRILNKKYELDKKPIDINCSCYVCKNYSRSYIRFLLRNNESVGKILASYHNLYYLQELIKTAKGFIRKGKFKGFLEKIKKLY